ncbi:MAG TPA: hypothetical protein VGE97_10610 [Nitrososphaera sp.]
MTHRTTVEDAGKELAILQLKATLNLQEKDKIAWLKNLIDDLKLQEREANRQREIRERNENPMNKQIDTIAERYEKLQKDAARRSAARGNASIR